MPADSSRDTAQVLPDDAEDEGDAGDPQPPPADAGRDARPASDAANDGAGDAAQLDGGDGGAVTGSVMVVRVGDGAGALSSASTAVFIDERALSNGALMRTITLPIAAAGGNNALTLSGSASSEGALARSVDGRFVTLGGYATAPGVASVSSSSTSAVKRAVARIDLGGAVDTSTLLSDGFTGGSVRGAVTLDGAAFWATGDGNGANGGVLYAALGNTAAPVQVLASPLNTRAVDVWEGQLCATSGTAAFSGVFRVGTGTPTTAAQTASLMTGTGGSPYGFVAMDRDATVPGVDTAYVADDRAPASGGGIQKWTLSGVTWSLTATFNVGLSGSGARGVVAIPSPTTVRLVVATAESPSRIVSYVDDGSPTPPPTVIATAAANTVFRGIALPPSN